MPSSVLNFLRRFKFLTIRWERHPKIPKVAWPKVEASPPFASAPPQEKRYQDTLSPPFVWCSRETIILSRKAKKIFASASSNEKSDSSVNEESRDVFMSNDNPFLSSDLYVGESKREGRGVFASRDLSYDKEIMRIPALVSYLGEGSPSQQLLQCLKATFSMVEKTTSTLVGEKLVWPHLKWISTLSQGGWKPFPMSQEVTNILRDYPNFRKSKSPSLKFLNDLASVYEFNCFEVKNNNYSGRAFFPEASLFNHDCDPNVLIQIFLPMKSSIFNVSRSHTVFTLVARTTRPVQKSEELLISYLRDYSELPLSKQQDWLRRRWCFECTCTICKERTIASTFVVGFSVFLMGFFFYQTAKKKVLTFEDDLSSEYEDIVTLDEGDL